MGKLDEIAKLRLAVLGCNACSLRAEAHRPVPFDGPIDAKLMIVGRNPGQQEDQQNTPFYPGAPGGRALTQALERAGLLRSNFVITNLVKCYTTRDRPPEDEPKRVCKQLHLDEEILLFKPTLVLALGNDAFRALTRETQSVVRCRRKFYKYQASPPGRSVLDPNADSMHECYVVGTWHPGSAVRDSQARQEMEDDIAWIAGMLTAPQQ